MNLSPNLRLPIVLSALLCPGVGQFVQGRWLAGLLFLVPSLALFSWCVFLVLSTLNQNLAVAFGTSTEMLKPMPIQSVLFSVIASIAIYGLNVWDVWRAANKAGGTSLPN